MIISIWISAVRPIRFPSSSLTFPMLDGAEALQQGGCDSGQQGHCRRPYPGQQDEVQFHAAGTRRYFRLRHPEYRPYPGAARHLLHQAHGRPVRGKDPDPEPTDRGRWRNGIRPLSLKKSLRILPTTADTATPVGWQPTESSIQLADDEYLMCGDNTRPGMSLDGRFFGGVPREDFQGPAIFVYWPFRDHWGRVR